MRITHPEFDVNDEALIDADPMTTFHALVDEVRGTTQWWRPRFEAKPRNPAQFGEVGSIVDVQIRWIVRPRFSARVREAEAGRRFRVEFFRGAFVGSGDWSFEPAGRRTHVQFRWAVRSNQWRYSLAAPFVDLEAIHSKVVHAGFKGSTSMSASKTPVHASGEVNHDNCARSAKVDQPAAQAEQPFFSRPFRARLTTSCDDPISVAMS